MSKTRDTGYLANVIQVHDTGVRIMSGSTMLMAVSSSGEVTITGEMSGSDAANALLLEGTGSLTFTTTASYNAFTSSYNTASSSLSSRTSQIEQVYATTGSNSFRATQSITGSLTVTGQIIAQTLNVQQVTSSIIFSTGSNTFGCDLNNRQTFTGSVFMTGSLIVNTTGPELQVTNNGVILGNLLTDNHSVTGSLRITGSVSTTGDITIGAAGQMCLTSGDLRYTSNAGFGIVTQNGGRLVSIQNGAFGVTGTGAFSSSVTAGSLSTAGNLNYTSGAGVNWYIDPPANGPTIRLKYHGGSTDRSGALGWVDNSGNRYDALTWVDGAVGIGTDPSYGKLSILGADNTTISSALWGTSTGAGIVASVYNTSQTDNSVAGVRLITRNSGASIWNIYNISRGASSGDLAFGNGTGGAGTEKVRILNNGNVGIGTCSPLVKFQVTQPAGQCMPTLGANCGSVFIAGDTNLYGLYIGNDAVSGNAWLQSMRNNSATAYNILLNPVGGNVAIGTTDAPTKLNMGGYVGSRLPYIDGTGKTFNSIGITVGSYNTGNAVGGGLDLTNNVACVGSYSPILSFSSLSSNNAYNNAYAGIWGVYQGAGGDANWNRGDLVFGTAVAYGINERMRISGGGSVSIGTSAGGGFLHIIGTGTAFVVGEVGGSAKQLLVGIDGSTGTSELQSVWQGNSYTRLNLNPIAGAVFAGATRLDTLSDARVKDNIQPITGALDKVLSITGKKFHLKDEEEGKIRYGFIAQELEGVLDEFVLQTDMTFKKEDLEVENVKSIDNWASSWSALLVEAIKEQQCKISTLESCLGIA
jgi:hypothetical protein